MNNEKLLQLLTSFYLDPTHETVYANRYDVWLIQSKNWDAYHMLILKSEDELKRVLAQARDKARDISTSPLNKALA